MQTPWRSRMSRLFRLPHPLPRHQAPGQPCRPQVEPLEDRCVPTVDAVLQWNAYMVQAEAKDYDPAIAPQPDQEGPAATARAFAIVSVAEYDAVNSIDPLYTPYLARIPHARGASMDAAVAQAAHDTLVAMFPHQQATFDQELTAFLAQIPAGHAKHRGIAVGRQAAANILAARANDGSQADESYVPLPYAGYHQPDPDHPDQGYVGSQWGEVRPFVIRSSNQFRAPDMVGTDPQSRLAFLNSQEYTDAYNQVMTLGAKNSTIRTADQTEIGIFWGYCGVPDVGTPPALFNEVTATIAQDMGNTEVQNARLFALVNLGLADAGISAWETKYFYSFWRPVMGIRNADATGNPNTPADPNWEPMGAAADNDSGTNFTPPFPSYVSGHATFAGTVFEILRSFYGTDNMDYTLHSDEFNGVTRDADGHVRPVVTRSFTSLTQAEMEVFWARIYIGVHWYFDEQQGDMMGHSIGDYVFQNVLQPRQRGPEGIGGDGSGTLTALAVGIQTTTPVAGLTTLGSPPLSAAEGVTPATEHSPFLAPAASSNRTDSAVTYTPATGSVRLAGEPTLTPIEAIDLSLSLPGLFG